MRVKTLMKLTPCLKSQVLNNFFRKELAKYHLRLSWWWVPTSTRPACWWRRCWGRRSRRRRPARRRWGHPSSRRAWGDPTPCNCSSGWNPNFEDPLSDEQAWKFCGEKVFVWLRRCSLFVNLLRLRMINYFIF